MLSSNAEKAAVERWWLLYTPVWGISAGAVMLSGWAERWGDLECLLFGLTLMLGALAPAFRASPRPWRERPAVKMCLSVVLFAFGLNYAQTPFFFDVLHMHYGFDVTWTIDRNPIFLYLLTVPYFATYCVLCCGALRGLRRLLPGRLSAAGWVLAPLLVAFLETLLNANPWLSALFCYDDLPFMLWFGTLTYGFAFVVALPVWMAIDEGEGAPLALRFVLVYAAAALFADWLFLEAVRELVAPWVTNVVQDAPGLRDYAGSCLER